MMLLQLKKKKKMEYLPRIMHLKAFKGVMRSCADLIFKEKKNAIFALFCTCITPFEMFTFKSYFHLFLYFNAIRNSFGKVVLCLLILE